MIASAATTTTDMTILVSNWHEGTPSRLAQALGWTLARPSMKPKISAKIVNWGTSHPLIIRHDTRIINSPSAVAVACSKLYSLRQLSSLEVPCLEFTEDQNVALQWLVDGSSVVCRDILNGKGGAGIRIINRKAWHRGGRPAPDFGAARLYTRYFPKVQEVRVHVFDDAILGIAEKRKRLGQPGDYWVRSHSRGWIFAEARAEFGEAKDLARHAIQALGLNFGAVDIGINANGSVVVFEVNTAPGLEGRTLEAYVEALR